MVNGPALDPRLCETARLSRDARFDGLFFTAVTSTGIYCRPVCPAPVPRRENVRYYPSAAAAEGEGFRPCLRCRPELSPQDEAARRGDAVVARALKLIDQGLLAEHPLATLAERVHLGERQLRRLFVQHVGASPNGVHATQRLLFAKQLLSETVLPITEVALAAGFGSLRRFNDAFRQAYRLAPRDLRKRPSQAGAQRLELRLAYRPPYDFGGILDFLQSRALPGVEHVQASGYRRVIGLGTKPAWMHITPWGDGENALRLELHGVPATDLLATVHRVRRMFDLDADPRAMAAALAACDRLRPLVLGHPGLRLPSGWDGFEVAVRAVIGQQVSVSAARTVAARLAARFGEPLPDGLVADGLDRRFPSAAALADADLDGIGLTGARAETVRTVARAVLDGRVGFRPEQTLEEFVECWTALPGIGPWTAHYLAMRALGHPDALPAEDLVVQRMLGEGGSRANAASVRRHAETWRPWRSYAVMHLWRSASSAAWAAPTAPFPLPSAIRHTRRAVRPRAGA